MIWILGETGGLFGANDPLMSFEDNDVDQFNILEGPKAHPVDSTLSGLPDLGPINSSDLSLHNLSASLSNINIGDGCVSGSSYNNLDKKNSNNSSENDKKNENTTEICTPNISLNDPIKSEDPLRPSISSDSFQTLLWI